MSMRMSMHVYLSLDQSAGRSKVNCNSERSMREHPEVFLNLLELQALYSKLDLKETTDAARHPSPVPRRSFNFAQPVQSSFRSRARL